MHIFILSSFYGSINRESWFVPPELLAKVYNWQVLSKQRGAGLQPSCPNLPFATEIAFFLTENFLVQEGKIGLTLLFIINIWHFCYCFSETRKLNLHWLDQIQLQESFVGQFSAGESFIQSNNIVRILWNRNIRNNINR